MMRKRPVIPVVVAIGLCAGVVAALVIAGVRDLTSTESVLLGIMLSAVSMLFSWLVTHLYSQANLQETIKQATDAHTENIRNYAVKAAEKVLNLSNELRRLTDVLRAAIEDADELGEYKESSALLQERISSAIHNLETLKSMNDTFLSDWRGVIGEEIERQEALQDQIVAITRELLEQKSQLELFDVEAVSSVELSSIEQRIEEAERRLTERFRALPFKVPVPASKPKKQETTVQCPSCGKVNAIRIRRKPRSRKLFACTECGSYAEFRQLEDGVRQVVEVARHKFEVVCPVCKEKIWDELPDFASASKRLDCPKCEFPLILSRRPDGVNVKIQPGKPRRIPLAILDHILAKLPPRPWPKGVHKSIAADLGVSNSLVARAVTSLIEEGRVEAEAPVDAPL